MDEPIRLAKRLAQQLGCSRREAELYIEGGWVRVNGAVVEEPQHRVSTETLSLDPGATLAPSPPVTWLLHKPANVLGVSPPPPRSRHPEPQHLLALAQRSPHDRSGFRPLKKHREQLTLVTPLETAATGLLVLTQDWRVQRKLQEDAALVEHELMVDVRGPVSDAALRQLNTAPVIDGRAMAPAKFSISRSTPELTGLRCALKGYWPGQIAQMCEQAGLELLALKRIRVGRVALAGLEPGQWRYLAPYERF